MDILPPERKGKNNSLIVGLGLAYLVVAFLGLCTENPLVLCAIIGLLFPVAEITSALERDGER